MGMETDTDVAIDTNIDTDRDIDMDMTRIWTWIDNIFISFSVRGTSLVIHDSIYIT
jgi:hypothetical protein